jgi:hypothetical protein
MTAADLNSTKISLFCKYNTAWSAYLENAKYSIKSCDQDKDKLILAGAMLHTLCRLCLNGSNENYCLSTDEICEVSTFICSLIKSCNCA